MMTSRKWIRIKELEKASGVPRRTIHFYLQNGLLHMPVKTGKTMAYYDETHIRRLQEIRTDRKNGLPIMAIREKMAESKKADTPSAEESDPQPFFAPQKSQGLKKDRARKTRDRIIDIGSRLFRTKGYQQTKVSDITTAMDVGKGTFYFHFPDKKALFLECVPKIFNELFASGWERIKKVDNARERLEIRAQLVLPVLREFCAILQLCRESLENSDPRIQNLGENTYRSIYRPIESDIERGIQQGIFKTANPRMAAVIFIGVMESANNLRLFERQALSPSIWESISQLILNGLLVDKG